MSLLTGLTRWTLGCVCFAMGATSLEILEHRPHRILGIEHGLESLTFNQLYRDRQGLIWIAYEQSGIGLFDGTRIHNFGLKQGLPSGLVMCLQEEATGVLWAGTYGGLVHWDGTRFRSADGPAKGLPVFALAPDPAGGMLAGLAEGLFSGGTGRPFAPVPGWTWGSVRALHLAGDGKTLWASSLGPDGRTLIHRRQESAWRTYEHPQGFEGNPVTRILADHEGRVWAVTATALWCLPPPADRFERVPLPGLHFGNRSDLALDDQGELWVCAASRILHRRKDGTWEPFDRTAGLPPRAYRTILPSADGTLWLGGAGLTKILGGRHLRVSTSVDGVPGPGVMAILRDRERTLWIGTQDGLARSSARGWKRLPATEGAVLRSLVQLADGRILACGNASRFLEVDPRTDRVTEIPLPRDLPVGRLNRMALGPDGTLFLATSISGLLAVDLSRPRYTPVALPGSRPGEVIFDLAFDTAGRLWVAGESGLALLERGQWRRFAQGQGLLRSTVRFVRPTLGGDLLVGYIDPVGWTRLRLHGGELTLQEHRHAANGSQDVVWLLCEDPRGRVWAGGAKGLDILSPEGAEHVGRLHGLPSDDCDAQAFLAEQDGQVWVGTSEGLAHFRMDQHPGLPSPPRPILVSLGLEDGTPIHPRAQAVEIPYRSTLLAAVAAVSSAGEDQVRLEARLRGLEEAWTPALDGHLRYPSLASGQYILEVRSRLGSGPWSPVEAFAFRVRPTWWQTWWFRGVILVGLGALLYLLTRLRTAVLTRRNLALEALVDARTTQLQQAKEDAERASGFKSIFLATVSHELRTPLHAVRGFLDLLDRGRVKPADLPAAVRSMKGASDALLELINDLLDLGRIETGALDLEPVTTDLRAELEVIHRLLVPRIEQRDLLLLLEVDPGVPSEVRVDARRLSQMVVNLVGNAIKFTSHGHVRTRLTLERREGNEALLRVCIEDTGPGMPAALIPSLFQPYLQGEGPMKQQGSGLGLSITRHLAERMGGEVGVTSTPGAGSAFWFTFRAPVLTPPPRSRPLERRTVALQLHRVAFRGPLASLVAGMGASFDREAPDLILTDDADLVPPPDTQVLLMAPPWTALPICEGVRLVPHPIGSRSLQEALAPPEPAPLPLPEPESTLQGRILLADDNPANRLLAGSVLGALGLSCTSVSSGPEALEALDEGVFDLVLLDGQMPGMNGLETLRQLRQKVGNARLPVLLFTASTRMDHGTALELGFDGFLPKPMDLDGMRSIMERYLPHSDGGHWGRLASVLGGTEGLQALASGFLEDGLQRMPALRTALEARDRDLLGRLAHDLKSNAGHLGLTALREAAAALERASEDASWERLAGLHEGASVAWNQARQRVEKLLRPA